MNSVTRTIPLRPFACRDKKTGTGLDPHNALEEVRNDATLCATEALKHITVENLGKLSEHDGLKPAVAGRRMGIRLSSPGRALAVVGLRGWSASMLSQCCVPGMRESKPKIMKIISM